jgi:hypothetical protein
LSTTVANALSVELTGATRTWQVYVDCAEDKPRLPTVWTDAPSTPLAHVSYSGNICIDDGQGLSIDPDRAAAVAAYAVLKAFDLLENSARDAATGYTEFFNELEGYWLLLPGSLRARAYFEVDGVSRLVRGFADQRLKAPTWYFVERDFEKPWDVKEGRLESHRVLYVHVDALDLPPVRPGKVTFAFVEEVLLRLSPDQLKLWTELVGPSKNSAKQLALLVSIPRQAGGWSLVGVTFGARAGHIDKKAPVTPLTMRRHATRYMRERGGASLDLLGKHVAVLGAGAVGSVVIDNLAAAGVGKLTVVDSDEYSSDNVFRHVLEPNYVDFPKPSGLKFSLERRYPGLSVTAVCETAQEWWKTADLSQYDGVVVAFGSPPVERSFSRMFKACETDLPVVFTWLEALDLGGHSLLMWSLAEGCLDCVYRDEDGDASQAPRTAFLEPGQPVTRNLTGCSGSFVPYGPIQARRTGLLAAEHMLSTIAAVASGHSGREASYRFWVGEGTAAVKHGLRTTAWFDVARRTAFEDAADMVFGLPCPHCRTPKEPSS